MANDNQKDLLERLRKYLDYPGNGKPAKAAGAATVEACLEKINQALAKIAEEEAEQNSPEAEAYRVAAKDEYEHEGEIEIDPGAEVSFGAEGGDPGAYVQAWVWVAADEDE